MRIMAEVTAAPGKYADPLAAISQRAKEHRENFCTQDQAKAGMCSSASPLAGANINVATLFAPMMESDAAYKAKVSFVDNLAGLPDAPVPEAAAKTPAAQAYMLAKARKDAIMSPALASMKAVQLDYTGISDAHTGADIPISQRFDAEVGRYLGNNAEYDKWSAVLTAQNTRGLLVEMLKVKALDLAILEKQYRQYERMEANLAAIVAAELRNKSAQVKFAADQAAAQAAKTQIK
jgi:hypothetical protein